MQLNCFPGDESALAAVVVVDDEALLAAGEGGERLDGDVAAAPALVQEGVVHREPGGNCIKIGLTGKSILRHYFQENRTSRGLSYKKRHFKCPKVWDVSNVFSEFGTFHTL